MIASAQVLKPAKPKTLSSSSVTAAAAAARRKEEERIQKLGNKTENKLDNSTENEVINNTERTGNIKLQTAKTTSAVPRLKALVFFFFYVLIHLY